MNLKQLFRKWPGTETHEDGVEIFNERDPADAMFIILDGRVQLSLHGEELSVEEKGGIIGELALTHSAIDGVTATAVGEVTLARLNQGQFKQLVAKDQEFALHVMAELANRLRLTNRLIAQKSAKKGPNRNPGKNTKKSSVKPGAKASGQGTKKAGKKGKE